MDNPITKKVIGFRKMGIAMMSIIALTSKPPTDFNVTVVICIITVVGITAQTILDWRNNGKETKRQEKG